MAKAAAKTLIDALAKAITTQAFIAHTSKDSEEEEEEERMAVTPTPYSSYPYSWKLAA